MIITDIEKIFSKIKNNSEYIRVSDDHPLELYIGLNEKGMKTLRFNGIFSVVKLVGNNILEIKQIKTTKYNSLLFSFNGNDGITIFYKFCEDLINQTANYKGEFPYSEIVNRYNQWRKMFYASKNILSEQEIQGLIGELLFLRDFGIKKYGSTCALNSWSGPEPTHKDFSYENDWYEIKSISNTKNVVGISSIEQLDSNTDGHLYIYYLEKMSPEFNGINLNLLVDEIYNGLRISTDKDIFADKLQQVGYVYNGIYDNFVYNLTKVEKYKVSKEFPRIKREDLPLGIAGVRYDVEISIIKKFAEE